MRLAGRILEQMGEENSAWRDLLFRPERDSTGVQTLPYYPGQDTYTYQTLPYYPEQRWLTAIGSKVDLAREEEELVAVIERWNAG